MKIILEPLNARAKGKLAYAGTTFWEVLDEQDTVSFSEREGPWWLCRPVINGKDMRDHQRWIHSTNDKDFLIKAAP